MFERVAITIAIVGGLGLLRLFWQYYQAKIIRRIQPVEMSTGKPRLLYFTGDFCTACKLQQTPIVEAIAAAFGDAITVKQYDVTVHADLANHYKILTVPTTIVVNPVGQVTHINYGVAERGKLEAQLLGS
jgi:thiol-disulfide isomerase/thioredoxin